MKLQILMAERLPCNDVMCGFRASNRALQNPGPSQLIQQRILEAWLDLIDKVGLENHLRSQT